MLYWGRVLAVVRGCQAPKRISAQPGRGAEASTVGVYRAELHKRALQWERATAYLAPSKAGGSSETSGATGTLFARDKAMQVEEAIQGGLPLEPGRTF